MKKYVWSRTVIMGLLFSTSAWAVTENVKWTNMVRIYDNGSGGILKRNGGVEGVSDSGAITVQRIDSSGGYFEFTFNNYAPATMSTYTVVGLGAPNNNLNYNDARYNMRFFRTHVSIYKGETWLCDGRNLVNGERYRIRAGNGWVFFYRNNVEMCSTTDNIIYPLVGDVLFATSYTNVQNAVMNFTVSSTPPTNPTPTQTLFNDYNIYPLKYANAPAKGQSINEPTFGTKILRITDSNDGYECHHAYSYWDAMNANQTKILVTCNEGPRYIVSFNPTTLAVGGKIRFNPPTGIGSSDPLWSTSNPDILMYHVGPKLYWYNIATNNYDVEYDFTSYLGGGMLWQMQKDAKDDVFVFTKAWGLRQYYGHIVWSRAQHRVLLSENYNPLDEVNIDKSGKYEIMQTIKTGVDPVKDQVTNLVLNLTGLLNRTLSYAPSTALLFNEFDKSPGHYAMGNGIVVGIDGWNLLQKRNLSSAKSYMTLMNFGNNWGKGHHISMNADNERWVLDSTYSAYGTNITQRFMDEIFQVATDGSGAVRRIAHTHSYGNNFNYWDMPKASISKNGRFVVFTSNWHGQRRDVYMAVIPPAP